MSVIFRTVERPSDPRVENSPKKYFPQLVTLGQSVNLAFIAQKMQDRSSLSIGDIRSVVQNFVEKLKEQLLEGKTVNIAGLGVFMLAAKSKGSDKAEDITAKSVDSVRICFQANKELKITKTATRAGEKLDLVSLDDYLKVTVKCRSLFCRCTAKRLILMLVFLTKDTLCFPALFKMVLQALRQTVAPDVFLPDVYRFKLFLLHGGNVNSLFFQ